MKKLFSTPKSPVDPTKIASISLICGIASWGLLVVILCLGFLLVLLGKSSSPSSMPMGVPILAVGILVLIIISIFLSGMAIVEGILALRLLYKRGLGKKKSAWVGIFLGVLYYLFFFGVPLLNIY